MSKSTVAIGVSMFFALGQTVTPFPDGWKPTLAWITWSLFVITCIWWLNIHIKEKYPGERISTIVRKEKYMSLILYIVVGAGLGALVWYVAEAKKTPLHSELPPQTSNSTPTKTDKNPQPSVAASADLPPGDIEAMRYKLNEVRLLKEKRELDEAHKREEIADDKRTAFFKSFADMRRIVSSKMKRFADSHGELVESSFDDFRKLESSDPIQVGLWRIKNNPAFAIEMKLSINPIVKTLYGISVSPIQKDTHRTGISPEDTSIKVTGNEDLSFNILATINGVSIEQSDLADGNFESQFSQAINLLIARQHEKTSLTPPSP